LYSALKKIFLYCLLLFPVLISAQQNKRRVFTGITLMPTIARSSEPGTLQKFSLNGEFTIRYQVKDWLSLETGPGIINHGFRRKIHFNDTVSGESWTEIYPLQINYFTLPLRVRFNLKGFTFAPALVPYNFLNVNPSLAERWVRVRGWAWQMSLGYTVELYSGARAIFSLFHTAPFSPVFHGYRMQNSGMSFSILFPIRGPGGFGD